MDVQARLDITIDHVRAAVAQWLQDYTGELKAQVLAEVQRQTEGIDLPALVRTQVGRQIEDMTRQVVRDAIWKATEECRAELAPIMESMVRERMRAALGLED